MTRKLAALALATSTCLTAGAAYAEPAALRFSNDWEMDLTWWLFGPVSTTGTSTVDGQSAEIDMNLRDALEVLDFASSLRFEAWKGDWGLILDANYLGISEDAGVTVGNGPFARDLDVEVETVQSWLAFMVGYRFAQGTNANGQPFSFDVQGGARYTEITQDVDIAGPARDVSLGGTEGWWEPVVGGRGVMGINEDWSVAAGAEFGGFGSGGNDLAWSANVAFDWRFSENASMKLGYRYYSIDFETEKSGGTFGYDVEQHGPFIGVTWALN